MCRRPRWLRGIYPYRFTSSCNDRPRYSHRGAIYNWFTEGFDTADLIEAKALLSKLGA